MTTPVIIDIFVVVFLVAFTIYGAKRGLLRSLAGIVILVVALVGAGMVATSFSGPVAKVVSPLLEKQIAQKVETVLEAQLEPAEPDSTIDPSQIQELLAQLGIEEEVWDTMTEEIRSGMENTGGVLAEAVTGVVVENLVHSLLYGILYVIAFVLLMLLLHVLLGAMGLVMKLPGLNLLNTVGGGLLGLIEGATLLFLAVWVGRRLGISFETELLAEAHILRIFTTHTPLSVLSFLQ